MHRRKFENFFNIDRKILYITLGIVLISIFSLTIIYAALSTTLNINGNAEVTAARWDIYLDNVQLNSGSATTTAPTITNSTTATFSTTLSEPGDFYEFTIDVVNSGSIDAMIDSITKTPELTDDQKKYLNYIVEYQNGESINAKQLVSKNSFVRLKVKLEFRKDITASDIPSSSETFNLAFTVNYVQSDGSNENVTIDNNGKLIKIASGDGTQIGDEICIGQECFYTISSDENSIAMLSKYNLLVGNTYDDTNGAVPLENPTGIQEKNAKGYFYSYSVDNPMIGIIQFSATNYWPNTISENKEYVYNENSYLYEHVENYKIYLESQGVKIEEARLIKYEELSTLGCVNSNKGCSAAPSWVYSTSY